MTLADKIRQLCRRMYADQFTGKAPELLELADLAEALERDTKRLAKIPEFIDGLGDIDLHERATLYASAMGREEPNDDDYAAAVRDAIDAAIAKEQP